MVPTSVEMAGSQHSTEPINVYQSMASTCPLAIKDYLDILLLQVIKYKPQLRVM
jgi:hypothetical protein